MLKDVKLVLLTRITIKFQFQNTCLGLYHVYLFSFTLKFFECVLLSFVNQQGTCTNPKRYRTIDTIRAEKPMN